MGYRSDICIGIKKEVKAWALINNNWPSLLDEADSTDEESDATFYNYQGWKWYQTYDEVLEVEKFLAAVEEQYGNSSPPESAYAFVRLGEEYEDIEVKGQPWDLGIEIHRTIERYSY